MAAGKFPYRLFDVILILSVGFFLYFLQLGSAPFFDKQEPREALVVWEINHSGNWILPMRNGTQIPSKPPLFHWLAAIVSQSVRELDEFTVRFPSAFLGAAGVLLTYFAGASLWGRGAGLISAMVLATSFEWRQAAKAARVDMTLTFVMLCAFLYFAYLYRSGGGRTKALVLGILLGLAALAKGPLGVVVPCFAYLIFLWLRRDLAFVQKLHPVLLLSACAIVAGSWYALALGQGGKNFLHVVIKENFSTVVGGEAGHPHPFFWYIPFFFQNAAPWSLFSIPVAIWLYRSRHRLDQENLLYFVVWFAAVFTFFSIFKQKRSVYILPLYPAFALLVGAWCSKLQDATASAGFLAKPAAYLNAAVFVLAALVLPMATPNLAQALGSKLYPKDQADFLIIGNLLADHGLVGFLWGTLCALGGMLLILFCRKNAWQAYFGCTAALMFASLLFVQRFDDDVARHYSFKQFTERVLSTVKDKPLYFYRSSDFGVTFYANKRVPIYQGSLDGGDSAFYLLCWENEWNQISDKSNLALEYASESVDRQALKHGHLYLVAVDRQVTFKSASGRMVTESIFAAFNAPVPVERQTR